MFLAPVWFDMATVPSDRLASFRRALAAPRCDLLCYGAEPAFVQFGPISTWDTSQVTDMSGLFLGESSFNAPLKDGALSVGDVGAASQDITTIKIMIARIAEQQRTDKSSLDQKLQSIIAHLHAVHGMRGAQGH